MIESRKVLVVSNMWPGEATPHTGVFVRRQVEALRAARPAWTFDVFTLQGWRNRMRYLTTVPRLRRVARRYDLVHAHYGLTALTAVLASARPLVTTLHGGEVEVPWQKPVTRIATRRSAAVIAVSEWVRTQFGEPDVRVISCGVPTDVFVPLDRGAARQRLGLPADAPVVLFPADPRESIKDHPLFEAAMVAVRKSMSDATAITLGVPPEDVPFYMAAADVVLLTSRAESGPLVVKEALACGVPVVAVDVGDVRETLRHVPGCFVVERDARKLGEAVVAVLREADRGRTARADAARRGRVIDLELDDASIAQKILAVYDDVLESRSNT